MRCPSRDRPPRRSRGTGSGEELAGEELAGEELWRNRGNPAPGGPYDEEEPDVDGDSDFFFDPDDELSDDFASDFLASEPLDPDSDFDSDVDPESDSDDVDSV